MFTISFEVCGNAEWVDGIHWRERFPEFEVLLLLLASDPFENL